MLRKEDKIDEFNKHFDKRKSECTLCGHRVSYKDVLGNIKFEGHYATPNGLYCTQCYSKEKH